MIEKDSVNAPGRADRSGTLRALGFALLLFGSTSALAGPIVLLLRRGEPGEAASAFIQGLPLSVTLLGCGFGLWRLRRWARQATIAVSFIFLAKGVLLSLQFVKQLPLMIEHVARAEKSPPPEMLAALQATSLGFAFTLYLFLPALYLWVVSGKNAAATFAAKDPQPSRLDTIPGPALALAFLFAWEGISLLGMLWFNASAPFFGQVLSGLPGACALAGLALICFDCSRRLANGKRSGWLLALGLTSLACLSWAATYNAPSPQTFYRQLYEAMGFQPSEIKLFIETESGPWNARWALAGSIATTAFILHLGRYFPAKRGRLGDAPGGAD